MQVDHSGNREKYARGYIREKQLLIVRRIK